MNGGVNKTSCSCAGLLTPVAPALRRRSQAAYLLTEALVYIALLFVVLGIGYVAVERSIDSSVVLRRNAEDIASALRTGERWRADIRACAQRTRFENTATEQVLYLEGGTNAVAYKVSHGALFRRTGKGPWVQLLDNLKSSAMRSEQRQHVLAWHWELELQPRAKASAKPGRVRPLFSFIAVPRGASAQSSNPES